MGIDCQIFIQRAKRGVFRPGEYVKGKVKYFINKPTKFKTINITFIGYGACAWVVTGPENSRMEYSNEETYVKVNRNLFKAKHDQEDLLSGTFEYPYEFLLPVDIPSTVNYDYNCRIKYVVAVTFVLKKKYWSTVKQFSKALPVYGYVRPCSPEPLIFCLQKKVLSLTAINNIDVKAKLEKTFLAPGEDIILQLTINNDADVPITIKTELIEYCTYISDIKTTKVVSSPLKYTKSSRSIAKKSSSVITCIVPILLKWCSIQKSKVFKGEFKVRVTVKLPFPYTNDYVEAPVVIGEMLNKNIDDNEAVIDQTSSSSSLTSLC